MDQDTVLLITFWVATGAFIGGVVTPVLVANRKFNDWLAMLIGVGVGAVGNVALNSPRLAGSNDWYLLGQLKAFRSGERGAHPQDTTGKQMRAMAVILPDDQALQDVVAYLASLGE